MTKIYEVGGTVRDQILGLKSKDVDFVMVTDSFESMRAYILSEGFDIYLEKPEYVTIRAGVPKDHPLRARCRDADFVLARKDGPSTDGRRPDYVEAGTLEDDLARRDFTVNALALDPYTKEIVDPHNGRKDLEDRVLRFVGDPMRRVKEDGLRVLRGFRFMITKGLRPETETALTLRSRVAADMLSSVSLNRVREEMEKMVAFDTLATLKLFKTLSEYTLEAIFREDQGKKLRLSATLKD